MSIETMRLLLWCRGRPYRAAACGLISDAKNSVLNFNNQCAGVKRYYVPKPLKPYTVGQAARLRTLAEVMDEEI